MTSRNRADGVSSTTPLGPMPALLTSTSTRPALSSTSPTPVSTLSSSATSNSTTSTATCALSASARSLLADAALTHRAKDAEALRREMHSDGSPYPQLAPVTSATAFSSMVEE